MLFKKSDLLSIISLKSEKDPPSSFDSSMAIDSAALLPVNKVSTFDEYASMVFCAPYSEAIPYNLLE